MPEPGTDMMRQVVRPIEKMLFHKTDEQLDELDSFGIS